MRTSTLVAAAAAAAAAAAFASAGAEAWPAAPTPALQPGCYADDTDSQRLLAHKVAMRWANMSLQVCGDACVRGGFRLAGVEASYGCFCGDSNATAAVPAPPGECCAPCTGNASQACGDKFRVWVYEAADPKPPTPTGCTGGDSGGAVDPRDIRNGTLMLEGGYLDQPYCDKLRSGRWICSITYDSEHEGGSGEHVVAFWSDDRGATWSKPVSVEPPPLNTELDNAYSMTVVAHGRGKGGADRTYVIYNMNVQNVTRFPSGATLGRSDMLGDFVMRFSDDGGETWSSERYTVPNPLRAIDRTNDWKGNMTIMWTVDQTKIRNSTVYFGFTKIGKYMLGPPEELRVLASPNLLSATDPAAVTWQLLPSGDEGIRLDAASFGKYNFEEAHVVPMVGAGAPGFYIEGRTTNGYLMGSETDDATGNAGWTAPAHPCQYFDPSVSRTSLHPLSDSAGPFGGAAAGLKNSRGPTTLKRFDKAGSGRYLLLYYNTHNQGYQARDPYWLAAGVEVPPSSGRPATILFSQPEIVIYDAVNKQDRPGYPDFIEDERPDGTARVLITETQKTASRLHEVPDALYRGLFGQDTACGVPAGAALTIKASDKGKSVPTPPLPALDGTDAARPGFLGLGFAVAAVVEGVGRSSAGSVLLDSANVTGGVSLSVGAAAGELNLTVRAGAVAFSIATDKACSAALAQPGSHLYAAVLDGGAHIATVMVDGVLCDGSAAQDQGWAWFPPLSARVRGAAEMRVAPSFGGTLHEATWWTRMVSTSELVGFYRSAALGAC